MAQPFAERELDDATHCSICTEVFSDPRVLPCIHTFCLKCLLNYVKDRQPGDTVPCPLCRNEFTIAEDGLVGIQRSFVMEESLTAENEEHILCHAGIRNEITGNKTVKSATMHCVHCQESYCDQCSQIHAKLNACTADHIQVEIGKLPQNEQAITTLPLTCCDIHDDKKIEVFCQECKTAICVMCFIQSHKNHDCSGVEKVVGDFRKQGKCDADKVSEELEKTNEFLCVFEKSKNRLTSQLNDTDNEINKTTEELIDSIRCERVKLLSEVESVRQKHFKQLETMKQTAEHHRAELESFKCHIETLLSSGTACDVARSAESIHDKAEELTKVDVFGRVQSCLPCVTAINFTASTTATGKHGNLIGEIRGDETLTGMTATHVVSEDNNSVGGVTSLGADVFVVRYNVKHIQVYDAKTFTLRSCLPVPGLALRSFGLAACAANNCLYVSEFDADRLHRIEVSGGNAVTRWSVASSPVGLSVNSAQNVLVVSQDERKLQEFTTHGKLVRSIQLQTDIEGPRHAIQISADKFLVSHSGSQHRVCMVDAKGVVVRSYGGPRGSDVTKMNKPGCLAVDEHGRVIVADLRNNRLLVLDQSLNSAREMPVSVDGGLQGPFSLFYDESLRRLHIGEWDGGRVIVIDNRNWFGSSSV